MPSSADYDSMIKVKVGPEGKVFELYKGVLKYYSGYFRRAIENIEQGRFVESKDNCITLPDEDPNIFQLVYDWLNTRRLPSLPDENDPGFWDSIVDLYLMSDRRCIPLLQNETLDLIRIYGDDVNRFPSNLLCKIYEHTTADSKLRAFLVRDFAISVGPGAFKRALAAGDLPDEFLHEVVYGHVVMVEGGKDMWPSHSCEWHVHAEGERCSE